MHEPVRMNGMTFCIQAETAAGQGLLNRRSQAGAKDSLSHVMILFIALTPFSRVWIGHLLASVSWAISITLVPSIMAYTSSGMITTGTPWGFAIASKVESSIL